MTTTTTTANAIGLARQPLLRVLAVCERLEVHGRALEYRPVVTPIVLESLPATIGEHFSVVLALVGVYAQGSRALLSARIVDPESRETMLYLRTGKYGGGEQLLIVELDGFVARACGRYRIEVRCERTGTALAEASWTIVDPSSEAF